MNEEEKETNLYLRWVPLRQGLRNCGVTLVEVSFSGSGDEGSINEYYFTPDDHQILSSALEAELKDLAEELHPTGYYNDEGGGGKIIFDVMNDEVSIDLYYNETVQHYNATDYPIEAYKAQALSVNERQESEEG